ncbi:MULTISPECIES: acyl-CoA dehydrogenase family protein [unclassified Streptomyces]|uniref:acyl-CoA dehydrogenase family protein n=1 Tax=unclassified Streptomyces TaxID=2593676 RepID=UPI0033237F99
MPTTTQAAATRAVRAHDAAALGARYATESEQARTLHPAVADALVRAGFARHFVPAEFGGSTGTFAELLEAVAEVGEGCTSAAWWAALQAAHGRLAAHLPRQGQADLWETGADTPVAAAVVPPAGELAAAPGGYLLTGRWNLASGVDHARWILLAAPDLGGGGGQRILAVPRADFLIHDTWHNSGLRGTGSHSVTVDAAFVPEHRTVLRDALAAGRDEEDAARCHRIPYTLVASLMFAAPALGAARGALRAWTALAAGRATAGGGRLLDDDAVAQQTLAVSSAEVDAAHLLLRRAAERADRAPLDDLPVALNMRDAAVAVEMLVGAVERLIRSGGARAQADGEPLQRFWRDVHALAGHGALRLAPAAAAYGRWAAAGADLR